MLSVVLSAPALGGDVEIVFVRFQSLTAGWQVTTTVQHEDSGWEHYADAWRVAGEDGRVFGTRTLYHPHVDEQPFTRSLSGVNIPEDQNVVYVEAHDSIHGWSPQRVRVELDWDKGDKFEVMR